MALTYLYVPGDRPDRFDKAARSGADVVVIDLEDAVAARHKPAARENARQWLHTAASGRAELRVNSLRTPWGAADLEMVAELPALRIVRVPKVESKQDAYAVLKQVGDDVQLHCLIESALGVENAFDIASADPRIGGLALGEADLSSDLGITDEDGLLWARSRIVVAARAAGLPPPVMSVYPYVGDLDGLARSCRRGRELGFCGRSAIHPSQLETIRDTFTPTDEEVAAAKELLDSLENAEHGVTLLPDGRMADPAMIGNARRILDLARDSHT